MIALRRSALRAAQACFAAGRVEKTYWAIVRGRPEGACGEISSRLGRVENGGRWRMEATENGAPSVTRWRCRGSDGSLSWLELSPLTGRTHQVRAHCAALGCPIVGDAIYDRDQELPLHLLARAIRLPLEPPVSAEAGIPPHMRRAAARCGAA